MRIKIRFMNSRVGSQLISLFFIMMLAACSTQAPTAVPNAIATSEKSIPVIGQDTPTSLPPAASSSSTQASTPACKSPATLTPALTEGPYFKAGSPERASLLENGVTGTTLTLSGFVLSADCKPVANALLDFWQANAQGQYDNAGYNLRGHQFTDANGHYQLVTIIPGEYPGRTEHIHVKVQSPNGPILTSQLFFPGVSANSADGIYDPALLINIQSDTSNNMEATYTFIVNAPK